MRKIACCNFNLIAKITYTYGIYYVLGKEMMISSLVKSSKLEGKKKMLKNIKLILISNLNSQFSTKENCQPGLISRQIIFFCMSYSHNKLF